MRQHLRIAAAVAAMGLISANAATAGVGEVVNGSIASQVTTKGTDWDGARHSADSEYTSFKVPQGYTINRDQTVVHDLSANGSEHSYEVKYDDFVELIPGTGIVGPQTIRVKTHARSPGGSSNWGCRGWQQVRVDFQYVRYAN